MHGLWTDEQKEAAERMKATIIEQDIRLIRVAWADQHGISRAKALTVNGFLGVLESGLNLTQVLFSLIAGVTLSSIHLWRAEDLTLRK